VLYQDILDGVNNKHQLVKSKKILYGMRRQSIKNLEIFWWIVYVGIVVSRRNVRATD
jgi:hypothetical protein